MDKLNGTQIALLFGAVCTLAAVGTGLTIKALARKQEAPALFTTTVDTDDTSHADNLINKMKGL